MMARPLQFSPPLEGEDPETCHVWVQIDPVGDDYGVLAFWLPVDHAGPHFDAGDLIWWERRER